MGGEKVEINSPREITRRCSVVVSRDMWRNTTHWNLFPIYMYNEKQSYMQLPVLPSNVKANN